jgi:hypothetical protein
MNRWITVATTLVLAASMTAMAENPTDPIVGTWVLNVAKSKYDPGPGPKSQTVTLEATADGMLHETNQITAADGTSHTESVSFKRDGTPRAVTGDADVDTVEITQPVNSRTGHASLRREGKVVGHQTNVISKDGKVATMTTTLTTASGKAEHDVEVYDRQ